MGDDNPQRPVIVFVHGGFMLTGCKEGVRWFCEVMAKRGYVVASVNYRKGWHKDNYVPAPNCLLTVLGMDVKWPLRCRFVGALSRCLSRDADVKGAIRWLKARAEQDSTCPQKVLVGGESAGAVISLAVAFPDRPEEKPASCHEIADAPPPYAPNVNCYEGDACQQLLATPAGAALKRPDLGPIEGRLNLNGFDANVLGVISFYGSVPYEAHVNSRDWMKGPDTPALYLYHRTCDAVVPFGYGYPTGVLSLQCNTGCTPWHYNHFLLLGSGTIASAINSMPEPPPLMTEFFSCQPFFGCLDYINNGSYHNILNPLGRAQKMASFSAPLCRRRVALWQQKRLQAACCRRKCRPTRSGSGCRCFSPTRRKAKRVCGSQMLQATP
ncbi:MAG: alpha/beta hydrolase [Saprospiraceae bacterium]|nr:alpha/beta hydrolase [Saprospiraceae bacterium]